APSRAGGHFQGPVGQSRNGGRARSTAGNGGTMKPSLFDYERVADPKSAIQLTQRDDIMVKVVAGSQSLGPMLNLRLVQPDLLVDITHVPEFKRVEET